MTDVLYGLTLPQHQALEGLVKRDRVTSREGVGVKTSPGNNGYRGICRVILTDAAPILYQPLTPRKCFIFRYSPETPQITVTFSGHVLEGDLVLTIGGTEIHVECNATTEQLRAALVAAAITGLDCRATVFPGLWEFAFSGMWADQAPSFTCEPFEPPEEDTETPVFSGELTIVHEGWVSATDDDDTVLTVETIDWVPFAASAITPGAIGGALWCYGAGWLVLAWQCRDFSFAPGDAYGGG